MFLTWRSLWGGSSDITIKWESLEQFFLTSPERAVGAARDTHFLPFPGKQSFPHPGLPWHPRLSLLPVELEASAASTAFRRHSPHPPDLAHALTQHAAKQAQPAQRESARDIPGPPLLPRGGGALRGRGKREALFCHWWRRGHVGAHGPSAGGAQALSRVGARAEVVKGWRRRRECLGTGDTCLARCLAAGGGWGRRAGCRFLLSTEAADGKRSREGSAPAQALSPESLREPRAG